MTGEVQTPAVPPAAADGVKDAGQPAPPTVDERAWVRNVETGQVRTIPVDDVADLRSPWAQITAAEAVRHHLRGAR